MKLVVFGLTISSSWGNGHATTYRALLKAFAACGHDIVFFERDEPWYADHRDLPAPDFCELVLYKDRADLKRFRSTLRSADAVMIGSFVHEAVALAQTYCGHVPGVTAFYDIDTPVTMANLARGACDYLSAEIIPAFDLYLSFTGGPFLKRIETRYGAKRALPLYCSADDNLYRPLASEKRWDLSYIGTYSDDRQPTLDALLIESARRRPDLRFVVAGPQYPESLVWPSNVERFPHVSPDDHAAFYAASRFTLNVTRRDMIEAGYSPSVRLFEAGACGCPVLSDSWSGLETFFESGREIVICSTTEHALAALDMPAAEAGEIGRGARARVLAAHTGDHRARELEDYIESAKGRAISRGRADIGEKVA